MADYWKSQPKKFCQYCKCWIADNKPSIEFHERGKNHKQNVAAKIEEIKKKSIDKAKQDDRMSKEFAAMEDAALKAYEEDMKRLQAESGATESEPQPKAQPRQQTKKEKKKPSPESRSSSSNSNNSESDAWVEGFTDDGLLYYYNTVTGESQWDKPGGFQSQSESTAKAGDQSESGSPWMEAVSPDGYTYYYNTETGESSWEKPEGYPSEGNSSAAQEEEPSPPKPEPLSEEDSSSNGEKEKSADTEEPKQPKIPKISFRKKKEEKSDASDEKEDEENKVGGDVGAEGQGDESSEDSSKPEPAKEEKDKEEKEEELPAKKPRVNPYGVWEQIQEEEDPYANVDLQLPQVDTGDVTAPPTELAPEPKPKFRERTITSLEDDAGTSTTFRKRKTENGKSRSLRQRGKDN